MTLLANCPGCLRFRFFSIALSIAFATQLPTLLLITIGIKTEPCTSRHDDVAKTSGKHMNVFYACLNCKPLIRSTVIRILYHGQWFIRSRTWFMMDLCSWIICYRSTVVVGWLIALYLPDNPMMFLFKFVFFMSDKHVNGCPLAEISWSKAGAVLQNVGHLFCRFHPRGESIFNGHVY